MIILLKWLIFLTLVVVIPIIVTKIIKIFVNYPSDWDLFGLLLGIILLLVYSFGSMYWGSKVPDKWITTGEYRLSGLSNNTYIKTTTSKSSATNSTVERYDYIVNESNGYRTYWVNAGYASVQLKDKALDLTIQKRTKDGESFAYKYILPHFLSSGSDSDVWYTFYVDPQYAKDNLGIQISGK